MRVARELVLKHGAQAQQPHQDAAANTRGWGPGLPGTGTCRTACEKVQCQVEMNGSRQGF